MIIVYGYENGCEACDNLKKLLSNHNIEYKFTEVPYKTHPFKTVPQTFFNGDYLGDYTFWKGHLNGGI